MSQNSTPPPRKPPRKTLIGVLGASAALMLMTAVPREESGRTVTAHATADGHVALTHIAGREYLNAYLDVVHVATACDGLTRGPNGKPIKLGDHFTEAQCDAMLEAELADSASHVMACTPGLEGHDGPKVASALLAHNIGWPAYCRSSISRAFNARDYRAACERFPLYDKAGGRHLPALHARRLREQAICLSRPARTRATKRSGSHEIPFGIGTPNYDGPPPTRFTRDRTFRIEFGTQARINNWCGAAAPGFETVACSDRHLNRALLPNPCGIEEDYAETLCHELGHLNGWPTNHTR